MDVQTSVVEPKVSVRWPIRLLAGLIVLVGTATLIGAFVASWTQRHTTDKWQWLAAMPGMLYLVRFAWYAAVRGRSPTNQSWPFASERVLGFYVAMWLAVQCLG